MSPKSAPDLLEQAEDVCALPLVRRLAALLDRDPFSLRLGDLLPRGWHVMMFNPPTRQSQLRGDGAAEFGVRLPDLGLPRLMLGGRKIVFHGDIEIGAIVRRETRQGPVELKEGRSGRFAVVRIEHQILASDAGRVLVTETSTYLLRQAEDHARLVMERQAEPTADVSGAAVVREITPDEALLFRYSAITDNPHRIHYDLPYAQEAEGYPRLLVNGSLPLAFLLEMFRGHLDREPESVETRNLSPMFCGEPLTLALEPSGGAWRLRARGSSGVALEGVAR